MDTVYVYLPMTFSTSFLVVTKLTDDSVLVLVFIKLKLV